MKHKSCAKEYEMDIYKSNFVFNEQKNELIVHHIQQLKCLCYVKYNGWWIKCYTTKIQ